jgi:hypothetical protein
MVVRASAYVGAKVFSAIVQPDGRFNLFDGSQFVGTGEWDGDAIVDYSGKMARNVEKAVVKAIARKERK